MTDDPKEIVINQCAFCGKDYETEKGMIGLFPFCSGACRTKWRQEYCGK